MSLKLLNQYESELNVKMNSLRALLEDDEAMQPHFKSLEDPEVYRDAMNLLR